MAHTTAVPPSRLCSPARRRGQDAAPNRRNDLDRAEHRHTINNGGTAAHNQEQTSRSTTTYTENLTTSRRSAPDHDYYAQAQERIDSKRAALSQARKIIRQACHILTELGDDALAIS